jgi:hypothetical protein
MGPARRPSVARAMPNTILEFNVNTTLIASFMNKLLLHFVVLPKTISENMKKNKLNYTLTHDFFAFAVASNNVIYNIFIYIYPFHFIKISNSFLQWILVVCVLCVLCEYYTCYKFIAFCLRHNNSIFFNSNNNNNNHMCVYACKMFNNYFYTLSLEFLWFSFARKELVLRQHLNNKMCYKNVCVCDIKKINFQMFSTSSSLLVDMNVCIFFSRMFMCVCVCYMIIVTR